MHHICILHPETKTKIMKSIETWLQFLQQKLGKAPSQKGFRSQLRGVCESLISASQVSQWADLCQLTQSCLESPSSESRELVEFLLFLTQLLEETLQDSQRRWLPVAREQFQLLTMLHDSLLSLDMEIFGQVQEGIAKNCEWVIEKQSDLFQVDRIVPQFICYCLMKSVSPDATAADVKRVHQHRDMLHCFDYQDESSDSMKELILYCYMNPVYLNSTDGIKFLAFAFTLDKDMVETIHETIKSQMATATKQIVDIYGDVYFRAWRLAEDPILSRIECTCIQDLMNRAVHASFSTFKNSAPQKIRKVLDHFHANKKVAGVDEMLCRLYEPIIWRSLNVANPVVRKNAATLLIDAFPIQDPTAPAEETDALLQKQFNNLALLLKDTCPQVRCIAVQGICRVFAVYWELIPMPVIADIMNVIVHDLAFDGTSSDVRGAVLQGLKFVLDNNSLSHLVLRKYLPIVGKLIHDTCHKNRVAFFDLLLTVKDVPDIKFWDVVDIPHLLYRLENDQADVAKRASMILLNSFFPPKKDASVKVARLLLLLEKNQQAARKFYFRLHKYVSLDQIADFVVTLYETMHLSVKDQMEDSFSSKPAGKKGKKASAPKADVDDEFFGSIRDNMDSLVDILAILMDFLIPELSKPKTKKIREAVVDSFEKHPLSHLLAACKSDMGISAIFYIARHALATNFVELSEKCQESLQKGSHVKPVQVCMLDCLIAWGLADQVFDLFVSVIEEQVQSLSKASKQKRSGEDQVEDMSLLFLHYLETVFGSDVFRTAFTANPELVRRLEVSLNQAVQIFAKNFSDSNSSNSKFLFDCVHLMFMVTIYTSEGEAKMVHDVVSFLSLLQLRKPSTTEKSKGKRGKAAPDIDSTLVFEKSIMMLVEYFALGRGSVDLFDAVSTLLSGFLQQEYLPESFMVSCYRIVYEMIQYAAEHENEADQIMNLVVTLTENSLKRLASMEDDVDADRMKFLQTMQETRQWLPTSRRKALLHTMTRVILKCPFNPETDHLVPESSDTLDSAAEVLIGLCKKDSDVCEFIVHDLLAVLDRCVHDPTTAEDPNQQAFLERLVILVKKCSGPIKSLSKRTMNQVQEWVRASPETDRRALLLQQLTA